jgi:hypothetical protein
MASPTIGGPRLSKVLLDGAFSSLVPRLKSQPSGESMSICAGVTPSITESISIPFRYLGGSDCAIGGTPPTLLDEGSKISVSFPTNYEHYIQGEKKMGRFTIVRVVSHHPRALGMTLASRRGHALPRVLQSHRRLHHDICPLVLANPDSIRPHTSSALQASSGVTWMTISLFFIPRCYIGRLALCGTHHSIVTHRRRRRRRRENLMSGI